MVKGDSLPSWDDAAGDPTTYEHTYQPNGNTQALMSANVRPDLQGIGLARKLIEAAQQNAAILGIEHLIGSFRPNQFGDWKLQQMQVFKDKIVNWNPTGNSQDWAAMFYELWEESLDFTNYISLAREDGLPVDGWLRNLTRNGMTPIKEDWCAMKVVMDYDQFLQMKQEYSPDRWVEVPTPSASGTEWWECGEVGFWRANRYKGTASYEESNLWGRLPLQVPTQS